MFLSVSHFIGQVVEKNLWSNWKQVCNRWSRKGVLVNGNKLGCGTLGLAEATLFFIVPDVLLSYIGRDNLRKGLVACLYSLMGAMIGCCFWMGCLPKTKQYKWALCAPKRRRLMSSTRLFTTSAIVLLVIWNTRVY